ncbi:conjugal transfer protein TraD [Burkholderia multivorans]|uniref:Conjugal transfer protein TraD n=1 Tax=Burkholderia multivorans TaxID=87883 RepID=A0AB37APW8_9BURK|nr:conjugal transfer protein TraD [Burkholderia multivorans]PRE45409.1 hypothetical protein C6P99_19075 [Burkholderia multivorans]PRE52095.1 hypothetical protein C6P97_07290 [Burkholderia multivorans]
MNDPWLTSYVATLRALKTPTEHQRVLLMLFDRSVRSADDERRLAALIRAEKAAFRAQKARANATRTLKEDRLPKRRARDQLAIVRSALVDYAMLEDRDPGELLGALLCFIDQASVEDRKRWKQEGDALIARQLMRRIPARRTPATTRIELPES